MTVQTLFASASGSADTALGCLSEDVGCWFRTRFGNPTATQRLACPIVAQGESVLVSAPTGSGKTLAAVLPIIDGIRNKRLAGLRCVYVAPLKALVQDACVMLQRHCGEIEELYGIAIRVGLRTGDTSPRARRQLLDEPPHILLTTPESLAVMLTHAHAAELFGTLRWVVVDEVHALAGNKRGADLALSLERLEALTNAEGLQRVGLSATCSPLTVISQFLAGTGRACRIVQVHESSPIELQVEPLPFDAAPGFMNRLVSRLDADLARNRTTLIFTSTRNLTERVTWALRKRYPERSDSIAAHHSALAPARRGLVEQALKEGRMWAVVTSTSLELGIDIGSVDGVVLVHPPGSVVRLLQRLGRSGHRPGAPRRGLVLTCSARALLEATVTADGGRNGQIEPLRIPDHPYDVLCQHLAGMAMTGPWNAEDAFALVRRAYPYRDLTLADFRECLAYLSGERADGTSWLPARLRWAADAFTIADERTARLLRRNLGTILTEQPCTVRMAPTAQSEATETRRAAVVGEVDEGYADRLQPGDRFMLDGRCLELRHREGKALLVDEVLGRPEVPRWNGSGPPMSNELARRLYLFRVQAAEIQRESSAALAAALRHEYKLNGTAAASLSRYITLQETISEVPDFGTLLIERLSNQSCVEFYFHTPLPRPANEAMVRVVTDRLGHATRIHAVPMAADLGFLLVVEGMADIDPDAWRGILNPERFAEDFAVNLRESFLLQNRFDEIAQTGLLALRSPESQRSTLDDAIPLFDRVLAMAPDFLLLRQAEREAGQSACDIGAALTFVRQVPAMQLRQRWLAEPSPFADSLLASHGGPLDSTVL